MFDEMQLTSSSFSMLVMSYILYVLGPAPFKALGVSVKDVLLMPATLMRFEVSSRNFLLLVAADDVDIDLCNFLLYPSSLLSMSPIC